MLHQRNFISLGKPYEPTNRAPRPFSTSYLLTSPSLSSIPMTSSRSITSTNASPAPSTRASPVRDFGIPASGYSSRRNSVSSNDIEKALQFPTASGSQLPSGTGIGSRRNSIVRERLPWPEPSPARELPPPMPKQKVRKFGIHTSYIDPCLMQKAPTQLRKMNIDHLLNKPYVNEVTLT